MISARLIPRRERRNAVFVKIRPFSTKLGPDHGIDDLDSDFVAPWLHVDGSLSLCSHAESIHEGAGRGKCPCLRKGHLKTEGLSGNGHDRSNG